MSKTKKNKRKTCALRHIKYSCWLIIKSVLKRLTFLLTNNCPWQFWSFGYVADWTNQSAYLLRREALSLVRTTAALERFSASLLLRRGSTTGTGRWIRFLIQKSPYHCFYSSKHYVLVSNSFTILNYWGAFACTRSRFAWCFLAIAQLASSLLAKGN